MKIAVILPAAGSGTRFVAGQGKDLARGRSKIEMDLGGRPVFLRAIEVFLHRPAVGQILLAVSPQGLEEFRFRWGDKLAFHGVELVAGGEKERWETVQRALQQVKASCTHVAIHDAARPLTSAKLVDQLFELAEHYPAVIPGLPVSATLKRVGPVAAGEKKADPLAGILGEQASPLTDVQQVLATVVRDHLVEVQTPQIFEIELLRRAYGQITRDPEKVRGITDDAGLVEALGQVVYVGPGEPANLKITRPADLELAVAIVEKREQKTSAELGKKRLFKDEDD